MAAATQTHPITNANAPRRCPLAREHARIWLDINSDDDFEALPFDAQGLYTRVILTLADLSYCGVATWRPRKLTTKAPDLTYFRIMAAASALEHGRYCLFDLDTEEVLARSYIRRDELLRNPKMAAAVIKAYNGIASKALRAAVVDEIRRVHTEHPEYSSWSHKDTGPALSKIMAKDGLDTVPYTNQITLPITNHITNGETVPITDSHPVPISDPESVRNTETDPGPDYQSDSVPIPSTYTSTSTPAPKGSYVSGVPHQSTKHDPNSPPPPHCPQHPGGTTRPCPACGAARQHRQTWDHTQAEAKAEARAEFLNEVADCPDCDELGWIDAGTNGVQRCPNHDWERIDA
ncbi:hypothetical protein [Mycolicibacterium sp. XJ1819]